MYNADNITSHFDNPERASIQSIENDQEILSRNKLVTKLLDGFPNAAMLLNNNRQIVAYNHNAINLVSKGGLKSVYGQRVGEAIGCIHAFDMPAGCGTSKFCEECGAGQCNKFTRDTLLDAKQECRVIVKKEETESSLDLRISTSIIELDENNYTLFGIEDIQDEKRRKILENIFFHDVLNTATAVLGISEIINDTEETETIQEFKGLLFSSSEQLVREIQIQRDLINAEQGTLGVNNESKSVNEILSCSFNLYKDHKLAKDKFYTLKLLTTDFKIITDSVLLTRSIGNLIKNALEATAVKGTVTLYLEQDLDSITFCVGNDSVIPEKNQLQIFQRSFSTKAKSGRGIGTYSVKLLVEQYLKGKVSFVSNEEVGTLFYITLIKNNLL
jgi:hypothetical protein